VQTPFGPTLARLKLSQKRTNNVKNCRKSKESPVTQLVIVKAHSGLSDSWTMAQAINYQALEVERAKEIQADLAQQLKASSHDYTRSGTLVGPILQQVAGGSYDQAIADLDSYLNFKKDYPNLRGRVERYLDHCGDLIRAVEAKRNFPGLGGLSLAKQQDIYDSVIDHFDELKSVLGQIEKIERDIKVEDMRTTTWFVAACMNAAFFIVSVGFMLEVFDGLGHSFNVVFSKMVDDLVNIIFRMFGY